MSVNSNKPCLLTGDTPTGRLHLGHWVGSIENRIALQESYDCYFLLANAHAFTTREDQPQAVRESTLDIALDYLSVGIEPEKSCIFIESEVPAIYELATWLSMLIPYPRLMRNPTIKDEIRDKKLGHHYSMGFLWYPILQVSDILSFKAELVPVGEDQIPHLELTREVARRFNQLYCGVSSHSKDEDSLEQGGVFPVVEWKLGRTNRLVGLGGPAENGQLLKMSKSFNNAIFLSDPPDIVQKKVMSMYTDPKRLRASDPGTVENNPLWIFHDAFNPDKGWVESMKEKYRNGEVGDVACKKKLVDLLVALLEPIQKRRAEYKRESGYVLRVLQRGAEKANQVAEKTLKEVKEKIHQIY